MSVAEGMEKNIGNGLTLHERRTNGQAIARRICAWGLVLIEFIYLPLIPLPIQDTIVVQAANIKQASLKSTFRDVGCLEMFTLWLVLSTSSSLYAKPAVPTTAALLHNDNGIPELSARIKVQFRISTMDHYYIYVHDSTTYTAAPSQQRNSCYEITLRSNLPTRHCCPHQYNRTTAGCSVERIQLTIRARRVGGLLTFRRNSYFSVSYFSSIFQRLSVTASEANNVYRVPYQLLRLPLHKSPTSNFLITNRPHIHTASVTVLNLIETDRLVDKLLRLRLQQSPNIRDRSPAGDRGLFRTQTAIMLIPFTKTCGRPGAQWPFLVGGVQTVPKCIVPVEPVARTCNRDQILRHTAYSSVFIQVNSDSAAKTGLKILEVIRCSVKTENLNIMEHQKTYAEEKPYLCDVCDKSFARNDSLKLHRR
ncbi:zinc finger protein 22-like, partial [Aphis craccivora]